MSDGKWISVEDALPDDDEIVLTYDSQRHFPQISTWRVSHGWLYLDEDNASPDFCTKHDGVEVWSRFEPPEKAEY